MISKQDIYTNWGKAAAYISSEAPEGWFWVILIISGFTCWAWFWNIRYCWHWSSLRFFSVQKWRTLFSLWRSSLRIPEHKEASLSAKLPPKSLTIEASYLWRPSGLCFGYTLYFDNMWIISVSVNLWLAAPALWSAWWPRWPPSPRRRWRCGQRCWPWWRCFDGCTWGRPPRCVWPAYTPVAEETDLVELVSRKHGTRRNSSVKHRIEVNPKGKYCFLNPFLSISKGNWTYFLLPSGKPPSAPCVCWWAAAAAPAAALLLHTSPPPCGTPAPDSPGRHTPGQSVQWWTCSSPSG